jgi:hypothetical protein
MLCRSRQPLLDTARELLAVGYASDEVLQMRHAGSDVVAISATIGAAARLTVEGGPYGPVFRPYRPHPKAIARSGGGPAHAANRGGGLYDAWRGAGARGAGKQHRGEQLTRSEGHHVPH